MSKNMLVAHIKTLQDKAKIVDALSIAAFPKGSESSVFGEDVTARIKSILYTALTKKQFDMMQNIGATAISVKQVKPRSLLKKARKTSSGLVAELHRLERQKEILDMVVVRAFPEEGVTELGLKLREVSTVNEIAQLENRASLLRNKST